MLDTLPRNFFQHAKNFFNPSTLQRLRKDLIKLETQVGTETASEREKMAVYRGETPDAIRLDTRWLDLWRDNTQELLKLIRPFTWVIYPVQVRHMRSSPQMVPWHQDLAFQKALGTKAHSRVITVFVPLDEDPYRRSTVQFAEDKVLNYMEHIPMNNFAAGLDGVDFKQLKHFQLQQGDCLVFGDYCPHRTFIPEGVEVERATIEFRMIRPQDAIEDKDYFDIESGMFIRKDGTKRERP